MTATMIAPTQEQNDRLNDALEAYMAVLSEFAADTMASQPIPMGYKTRVTLELTFGISGFIRCLNVNNAEHVEGNSDRLREHWEAAISGVVGGVYTAVATMPPTLRGSFLRSVAEGLSEFAQDQTPYKEPEVV